MDILGERPGGTLLLDVGNQPEAVWGGTIAAHGSFSSVGAVLAGYSSGNQWYGVVFCSATLIHDRWVITAAHCVEAMDRDYSEYEFRVIFGEDVYGGGSLGVPASDWVRHPLYDGDRIVYDVGLIELASSPGLAVQPVNTDSPEPWVGTSLLFVGYGVTSDGGSDEGIKRWTELQVLGCMEPEGWIEGCDSTEQQILFSQSDGSNVCQGDSGGAALRTVGDGSTRLVGVNSFVSPSCVDGGAGVARVDVFLPWIEQYVPDLAYDASDVDQSSVSTPEDGAGAERTSTCATGWGPSGGIAIWVPLAWIRRRSGLIQTG